MTVGQDHRGFQLPDTEDRLLELGRLAGGLVHELKNPLGAIRMNAELLRGQVHTIQPEEERDRFDRRLRRIESAANGLEGVVRSFLLFTRPERPDPEAVDVNALVADLLGELEEDFARGEIQVALHLDHRLPLVPADRAHLQSILGNVIANAKEALQSREADRRLLVVTRSRPGAARVVIANNGPPIPEQVAAHLFQPFVSGSASGTGLGLAIVKRLVELHRGTIEVASDESGVSFTIEFPTPLGPAQTRPALPAPAPSAPKPPRRPRAPRKPAL